MGRVTPGRRFRTIREIDEAGFDLRLWCYHCQRAARIDAIIWMHFDLRGLSDALDDARAKFPCRTCGARDCLIVTATRPRLIGDDATAVVTGFFHRNRSAAKKRRRW